MSINTRWLLPEHRDPEAKEKFLQAIFNSTTLQVRFLQILNDMEENLYKYEGDLTNYTEGWASKQAFINGQRKTLRDVRALFNFG